MKKTALLALALLVVSSTTLARNVVLVAHNQRSSAGALSTLSWQACAGPAYPAPCVNPGNSLGSGQRHYRLDSDVGLESHHRRTDGQRASYEAATYISSNPAGWSILADRVFDLVVDVFGP